jgi:hypothetical protein
MRARVTKALRPLDAIAVENPARPGTPDVNFVEGWVELKWVRAWPKNETTIVPFKHFTPQQRVFHIRRRQAGGISWVLIQCRREWILLAGEVAALVVGQSTRQELFDHAHRTWTNGLVQKELVECISQPMKKFSFTDDDRERLKQLLQKSTTSPSEPT